MPTSKKRIEANRRNAQKSTGPKTAKGKKRSSQNATRHGLYSKEVVINSPSFRENRSEYERLLKSLTEDLKPQGQFQYHLVEKIANCLWRSRRVIRAETAHLNQRMDWLDSDIDDELHERKLRHQHDCDYDYSLTPTEKQSLRSTSAGLRSVATDRFGQRLLHLEMRLDRQLSRAYRLLNQLQSRSHNETIPPQPDLPHFSWDDSITDPALIPPLPSADQTEVPLPNSSNEPTELTKEPIVDESLTPNQ